MLLIAMLAVPLPSGSAGTPLSSLLGKWVTAAVPEPGSAPMVPPSFAISESDSKVFVTFERAPTPVEAVRFGTGRAGADDVMALLIRYPPNPTAARMVMLRPLAAGQLRYELYVESTGGQSRPNWSYTEVFTKAK
jgi:hypothetical protein